MTKLALVLSILQATRSQPHIGRLVGHLPNIENTIHRMMTPVVLGTRLPRIHCNSLCSIMTTSPSIPSFNHSRSLHSSPNWARYSLTRHNILIDIYVVHVRRCHAAYSSCTSTVLIIAFMMRGATFRPNPKRVRQYLFPSTFTVWNGHNDSWTRTWRYTLPRSSKDMLEPFCRHLCGLATETSALAVNVSTWWLSSQKSITGHTLDLFCCSMAIRGNQPFGRPQFFFWIWHEPAIAHPCAELTHILLPDLHCYQIVQFFRCMILLPLPCCSPGSALMVKSGSEVGSINCNGHTLSYLPIADLYLSQWSNSNTSHHFYGINPQ